MDKAGDSDDTLSVFKKKVEEAISLVCQIPAEKKQEVWNFWELMSKTVKLFTQVFLDGVQTFQMEDDANCANIPQTKKRRGRPKSKGQGKNKKKISKEETNGDVQVENIPVGAQVVIPNSSSIEEKCTDTQSCASDHATVEDVVSSFNLDFSDLMSIPSSVEAPQSQMSNVTLQSPDPLNIENVMTPVSNKEDFIQGRSEITTLEGGDTSSRLGQSDNLTGKENIVPSNEATVNSLGSYSGYTTEEVCSVIDLQITKATETSVRRSRRPRGKKLKDADIYNYENKVTSTETDKNDDGHDDDDDHNDEGEFDLERKNKKHKRKKQKKSDRDDSELTCKVCDQKLSSIASVTVHMRKHSGDRPYECKECGSTFTTKGNMLRHVKSHTGERPFKCTECDKRFTEAKTLKVHMRTHTGERPYKCKICGQTFTQSGVLQNHMHTHTGHQGHLCDWCGKGFRQKSNLTIHVKRHLNSRDYPCDSCHYSFFSKGDLARHRLKHTGEKPYLCELCPKSFTRLQYLNEHMNQHLGNKPHTCKICSATFFDLSTYHRHISKHRKEEKGKSKEKEEKTTRHIVIHNSLALQQLGAVINQDADQIQQQNNEQTYQTIILSAANDSQAIGSSNGTNAAVEPGTSYVETTDNGEQQEVYLFSNDHSQLIATVDFSAINLLANATTKQFAPS